MHILHCVARAKLLDLTTMKVVKADVYRRGNTGEKVFLPPHLYSLILRRLNKNRRVTAVVTISTTSTGIYDKFLDSVCRDTKVKEKPNPYAGQDYVEFTFAQKEDENGFKVGAISLTSKQDKFTKRFGSMIACGRVAAGLQYLNGERDDKDVLRHRKLSTFAEEILPELEE